MVVDNLGLTVDQRAKVKDIVNAIQQYVDGHLNESVERRNFRHRRQQPGETFDDYLVALRELAKTCKFCSDECLNKNIRDQIIEGLVDGDTIETLLREKDLTLEVTITRCRGQEAAKKQRAEIVGSSFETTPYNIHRTQMRNPTRRSCPGCGGNSHPSGRRQCPAYSVTCHNCKQIGHLAKVCRSRPSQASKSTQPFTNAISVPDLMTMNLTPTSVSKCDGGIERAPTIKVHLASLNGMASLDVLPDSGADISVAGIATLNRLNEFQDNLLPSKLIPRAVNGTSMQPIGKLPVTLSLEGVSHQEDLHIYPQVTGTILSWKASKGLNILSQSYPQPATRLTTSDPSTTRPTTSDPSTTRPTTSDPSTTRPTTSDPSTTRPTTSDPSTTRPTTSDPSTTRPTISDLPTVYSTSIPTSEELMLEFPTVFRDEVMSMDGEEFNISLTGDAKPFCVNTPRAVPYAYREKLQAELQSLESQGIIAPVTEPTEWCAPIVVAPKKDSEEIRMCVDLSHLNKYVRRERYQSPTPAEAVADIAAENATIFTKIDARKGYHQCPLDEQSQLLTTFITPFGRFKYLRAPYGISSISEHYNRRMSEALSGLSGFRRIVDDIVIYDHDPIQHVAHVRAILQRCAESNITLNATKFKYAQPEVQFAGFVLSKDGYKVDPGIVAAIQRFPTPTNRTDLRSLFGLVNQLSASNEAIASLLTPLRSLLSIKNEFVWEANHDLAFSKVKESLISSPVLSFFDITRPTRLCVDASRLGLGFVLQQKQGNSWTLVQAGSRFLSDAESRYAIIELEMLAVTWAITKCRIFLEGMPHFQVITDHHPLISILNSQCLNEIENPRLQRLKARTMPFSFTAEWIKGTLNQAPDALSRYPVSDPLPQDSLAEKDINDIPGATCAEIRTITSQGNDGVRIEEVRRHANGDEEYQRVRKFIVEGFPKHRSELPVLCRRYWCMRQHLSIDDDLIVCGCRLLIPTSMRRDVLQMLHESHQGCVRTKERARLVVYWPGIDNDIDNVVLACKKCQDLLPSNCKEPIITKPKPERPFQELAGDFCCYGGQNFLILVDCYSDWPDIIPMGRETVTSKLLSALRQSFCRIGVPDTFWSDQGPQFMSRQFQSFASQWGFKHVTSSPRYPQSNGKAEVTVKSMKKLIRTSWTGRSLDENALTRALLQYRNTPSRKDGLSPAQKLFGRPIQDTLPAHRRAFSSEWQKTTRELERHVEVSQETTEAYYNRHAHSLSDISVGSNVAVHNGDTKQWDIYGIVVDIGPYRKYFIKLPSGRVLTRNRRFLRRRVPVSVPPAPTSTPAVPVIMPSQPPRRSSRPHRRPNRLIEEITF